VGHRDRSVDRATGQGKAIIINGAVVTTDSSSRFSLTGLPVGSYTAWLELPAGASLAAIAPVTVLPQTGAAGRTVLWLIAGLVSCGLGIFINLSARKGKKSS
jgi:hypothetical protein